MEDVDTISSENETLAISIRGTLDTLPPLSSKTCIYLVPETLRKVSESAYTPQLVSIGPFHRNNRRLGKMEEHKRRYLKTLLEWCPGMKLESCIQALRELEGSARECYARLIELNSNQFVEMMLLDGFFIIVFLLKFYLSEREDKDPILDSMWMPRAVQHDMILLENQLPFFILKRLFDLAGVSNKDHSFPNLFDLTIVFFSGFVSQAVRNQIPRTRFLITQGNLHKNEVRHILDLFRNFCIPSIHEDNRIKFRPISRHSVTELHEVGVIFKAGVSGGRCLLDMKFTDGVFEIQPLLLGDTTEPFLRNLIALEQCHYPTHAYVTDYAIFLDCLINTPKDAGLLTRHKIIENYLGDLEEVSRFINNLSKDVVLDFESSNFIKEYVRLDAYCNKRRHKWITSLRRTHFHSPWAIISLIAAVFLLILTLVQSVCSVISLKS